jgi:hypothetical protein
MAITHRADVPVVGVLLIKSIPHSGRSVKEKYPDDRSNDCRFVVAALAGLWG